MTQLCRRSDGQNGGMAQPTISAIIADITKLEVDAIVNAANTALVMGGGVDGAIHRAAGVDDLSAACAALGGCQPGDAKATPGFGLHASWIIHTVGPVWQGGRAGEPEILASCYRRSIRVAEELGASSVAFPAISTGIFGYPREEAAEIAITVLQSTDSEVRRVVLAAFDRSTLAIYQGLLGS
jgi:O-acetyl-ADP-ribose deacetylase